MEVKYWTHSANTVEITDGKEDGNHNLHVYTGGSKSEHGVGSGISIFKDSKLIDTKKYKLNGRCSNNQAEQMAIIKAPENLKCWETNDKTALIFADSRITLESLKNRKNHTYLIERIRKKAIEIGIHDWKIKLT